MRRWNEQILPAFETLGKMSRFADLWVGFTCGQLEQLLEENAERNLPMIIRTNGSTVQNADSTTRNLFLESDYTFVGVVYWKETPRFMSGVFTSPLESDNQAFAAARVFIPRNRLVRTLWQANSQQSGISIGGVPGQFVDLPPQGAAPEPPPLTAEEAEGSDWIVVRQGKPTHWDLLNQSWSVRLVPAVTPGLVEILQKRPVVSAGPTLSEDIRLPDLSGMTDEDAAVLVAH